MISTCRLASMLLEALVKKSIIIIIIIDGIDVLVLGATSGTHPLSKTGKLLCQSGLQSSLGSILHDEVVQVHPGRCRENCVMKCHEFEIRKDFKPRQHSTEPPERLCDLRLEIVLIVWIMARITEHGNKQRVPEVIHRWI
jgi:hypothetical protein